MLKLDEDIQKELTWASSSIVAFLILLVYGGTSPAVIAIALGSFAVSWLVISYSVKNFGPRSTSKEDFLQKEFQWFAGILVIFLTIVTLIGTTDDTVDLTSSTYVAVIFGFTLIWVVRSAAIKYFSQ